MRGVFTDARREDQRLKPAKGSGERADPFPGLITKQIYRRCSPLIHGFTAA
jgi:hypothetical protein